MNATQGWIVIGLVAWIALLNMRPTSMPTKKLPKDSPSDQPTRPS